MEYEFSGEVVEWRGPSPYHFVPVPHRQASEIKAAAKAVSYGWGMLPTEVAIGSTRWKTSLYQKDDGYWLPLRDSVRKPLGLGPGDPVHVRLTPDLSPRKPRQPPAQRRRPPRPVGSREPVTDDQLRVVPANEASWDDLRAIFDTGGDPGRCWCQRFRMLPLESWASEGPDELAARLRDQTACGDRTASATSGLVGYLDGEPVGWCAVAPRSDHARLLRDFRIPWLGRTEDKTDPTVFALTCFVTRAGYRRRGISRILARAAVAFARDRGARALEGYPDFVDGGFVGTPATFLDAGFAEVSRPGPRRAVMRIDF
ncbi:GNAT family N-acetyltransferase [Microlunatus parietis]|uniref:GNAT superfamily N-acetyltransferase n=1 Tax=Microlunatus parietis TaxID=682979 RepID=A0A7Y9LFU9_9ACTN|nr:GNAT family N-acetyltransferase [Microlunatus parietis]NYE75223.1 GNAT superfamily N-acetyltransferase [Microlunatus parietis]